MLYWYSGIGHSIGPYVCWAVLLVNYECCVYKAKLIEPLGEKRGNPLVQSRGTEKIAPFYVGPAEEGTYWVV